MRNKLLIVAAIVLSVFTLTAIFYSLYKQRNSQPNGFLRNLPIETLKPVKQINFDYNSYYFAGFSLSDKVFLGNTTAPLHVLFGNKTKLHFSSANLIRDGDIHLENCKFHTAFSAFIIIDIGTQSIHYGTLADFRIREKYTDFPFLISDALLIASNVIVIKAINKVTYAFELVKLIDGQITHHLSIPTLTGGKSQLFSMDGMLIHDQHSNSLIYTTYQANKLLRLDTAFNLQYAMHTIDTISSPIIKTGRVDENNLTMASPQSIVNLHSTTANGYIFILSNLRADNEIHRKNNLEVVDVYNLSTGIYLSSFYLPYFNGQPLKNIFADHQSLYAIYGQHLLQYKLSSIAFTKLDF